MSFRLPRRCEIGCEYPNLVRHKNLCFQNQRCQSVKEGTAGTKDAREYDKVHRRAVRSGNSMELTRVKPTEQLQLSLVSAFNQWSKDSKGSHPEMFVSTVKRYRCKKRIRKDIERA